MRTMMKIFVVSIFALVWLQSNIALADEGLDTVEKWVCSRDELVRTVRLVATAPGRAPCKVFYAKRELDDPSDTKVEARENSGEIKPIFYATHNGGFCERKLTEFVQQRQEQKWGCSKL